MSPRIVVSRSAWVPIFWVLSHPGTNGYTSTWGPLLSGTTPGTVDA